MSTEKANGRKYFPTLLSFSGQNPDKTSGDDVEISLSTAGKAGNIEECILGLEAMTETSSVEPDIGSYTHGRLSPDARIVLPQVIWTEITHTKIIRHQRPSTEAGPRRSIDKVECHIAGETT